MGLVEVTAKSLTIQGKQHHCARNYGTKNEDNTRGLAEADRRHCFYAFGEL
jgi:hypothetical protein